jgi:hypothetical protein
MKKLYSIILCLPLLVSAQVPCYVPTSGLLAWYSFNGNANDLSGNAHTGTAVAASLTSDRYNNAASAYSVGTNSYIAVADNSVNLRPTNITVAGWACFTSAPSGYNIVVGKGIGTGQPESVGMYLSAPSTWMGNVCGNGSCGPTVNTVNTPSVGAWYHVVYEFDDAANIQKFFLNGVLTASGSVSHSIFYDTRPWTFGCEYENGAPDFFLKGKVDDIGIWNRLLTQAEVTDLYNALTATLVTQPASQTVAVGGSTTFIVATSITATYQWQSDPGSGFLNLSNGGQYSGVTTPTLAVSNVSLSNNNDLFRCIVVVPSCSVTSNTATLTVFDPAGLRDTDRSNAFKLYPNPVTNNLYVSTTEPSLLSQEYKIINMIGVVIRSGALISGNAVISTDELANGVYFISIGKELKKIVKIEKQD